MDYQPYPLYLMDTAWPAPEVQQVMDTSYEAWLTRHSLPEGKLLYHYTTLAGLRGIMSSRSIWLGHAYSLNDPSELAYGRRLVGGIVDEIIAEQVPDSPAAGALRQLRQQTDTIWGTMFHTFVASFCESGDILSQWREYGERGGGYSLGFAVTGYTLARACTPEGQMDVPPAENPPRGLLPYLRKVLYDPDEQDRLVRSYALAFVEAVGDAMEGSAVRQLSSDQLRLAPVWMGVQAANFLSDLTVSFKHPAFQEEQEWRMVRVVRDNVAADELRFREHRGGLIPYRPMHLYNTPDEQDPSGETRPMFPLREIWYGPTLDPLSTHPALYLLAQHEHAREHEIVSPQHIAVRSPVAALR